ncbi:MAG TPA: bifunctional diaminohydroxyphosphoribosylaminopyrimidine deaminase/5-amino-6-(5-phosphoribosylamino)uracil reductase RibD [Bacillota bacterium]|nr:bifunctional diaminohydroxyphosphoribosylaminopyrimidine deaminase/5-amino-6-(5-phosphoribosylamino)uracil reductase RibD [Bacillota bacterium]
MTGNDEQFYMKRALQLAKRGSSLTHPNPMVGAVIVKEGRIIGEGWHHGPGLPHAEVEALKSCTEDPKGSTMYVTLEPCNHWGRTPPCAAAVIEAGIAVVKVAAPDLNRRVTGGGNERLRAAGITVEVGLLEAEALALNRSFFHHCQSGRPWVIMKSAASLDGKITGNTPGFQWITGEKSRLLVHRLRSEVGAVLVGSGTLICDNPQLTNRLWRPIKRQPLRVVLDSELKIPLDCRLLSSEPQKVVVFCNQRAGASREGASKEPRLQKLGVTVICQDSNKDIDLHGVLDTLGAMGVLSVLVEGGSSIFTSFLEQDLVDEFFLFYAPYFIGGSSATPIVGGMGLLSSAEARRLRIASVRKTGDDVLIHAYAKKEAPGCLRDSSGESARS